MIAELIFKAKDLLHSERDYNEQPFQGINADQIKGEVFLSQCQYYREHFNPHCPQRMHHFFVEYFCKDIQTDHKQALDKPKCTSLFQDLKSPSYRASLIQALPASISRLLTACREQLNNQQMSQHLILSPHIKHEILHLANQPPFHQQQLFYSFKEVQEKMNNDEFSVLISCCLLKQHCILQDSTAIEQQLFKSGVKNAYICFCLAKQEKLDAVSAFINGFIPFISLIYLKKEIQRQNLHIDDETLLSDIVDFLPRFNYWLAKDWGLPEGLLVAFKDQLIDAENLSPLANIMQTANHAHLTLMLEKDHLISNHQANYFMQTSNIDDLQLKQYFLNHQH